MAPLVPSLASLKVYEVSAMFAPVLLLDNLLGSADGLRAGKRSAVRNAFGKVPIQVIAEDGFVLLEAVHRVLVQRVTERLGAAVSAVGSIASAGGAAVLLAVGAVPALGDPVLADGFGVLLSPTVGA